ncbi:hypothetical protein [Miltoncostaea marina]|uniref:hypothetical protein n=1 Tax=Miltoncostaea marina TaxID=2843215 RepID=UPI001C3DEE9F|nr:hypothetical protein [Miltoncostaea marina]
MRWRGCPLVVAAAVAAAGCAAPAAPGGGAAAAPTHPAGPGSAMAAAPGAPPRSAPFAIVAGSHSAAATARVAAGGRAEVALRVANASDAPRRLALVARASWLRVPGTVRVPARQSVAVTAVAAPPAGTPAGTLRGAVAARGGGDAAAAVSVAYESVVPVVVHVTPAAR